MNISIIIPLWTGIDTIAACLHALTVNCDGQECEIICVDNASPDASAAIIAAEFPDVKLVRQPVNLGFAGGVNAGIAAAQGDLLVLLNQDCIVQPGWLEALAQVFQQCPTCGIAGCTILNPDGTINHAGAYIKRPGAYGVHLTEIETDEPATADYVTGAAFAIRRKTWESIGPLDENFYPAYYEESDYCYRARRHGFETVYSPESRVSHLFSAREWQSDPIKHAANQHQSRFRFVCKQFESEELQPFFVAELADIAEEIYIEQVIGRMEGARHTLRTLPEIVQRRAQDNGMPVSESLTRQLSAGFANIWRQANGSAVQLAVGMERPQANAKQLFDAQRERVQQLLHEVRGAREEAHRLRQLQDELLNRIYFRSPTSSAGNESTSARMVRLLIKRPASILSGRDYVLRSKLNVLQAMHMEQTEHIDQWLNELLDLTIDQVEALTDQQQLLRLLTEYEYR